MRERLTALGVPCPRHARVATPRRRRGVRVPVRAQDHPRRLRRQGRLVRGLGRRLRRRVRRGRGVAGSALLAEERVDFRRELAALVARSPSGQAAAYPVVASTQRDGICHEVVAPAPDLDADLAGQAQRIALTIAGELGVTGILAVELFETTDGRVLVNELAMRPHNTGHWTQDGAVTSQFENHLRAVLDLPLGSPVAASAVDGDGQHPRRPGRGRDASTTATPTRWPATRGCGCTSTARSCVRAARSATSTPTATTWTTVWSVRGTPPRGSVATWATRASRT